MASSTRIRDALARRALSGSRRAGVPDPVVDAELLAGHAPVSPEARCWPRAARATTSQCTAADAALDVLVERRATREPLQHITGTAPFRHRAELGGSVLA